MAGFQVNAVTQYNGPIERESWFRTIPIDEFDLVGHLAGRWPTLREWALHSALPPPSFFSPRARSTTDCPVGISIQCRCGCPLCRSFGKCPGVHRLPVRCMAQIGDL